MSKLLIALALLAVVSIVNEVDGFVLEPCLVWMKPQPVCPTNERYTCCKTCFEATCKSKNIVVKCPAPCVGGCICKPGHVRVVTNGKCIPKFLCGLI